MKRRKKQKTKKENEEEDKNKRKYAHVLPPHAKSSRNANDSRAPSCPAPPLHVPRRDSDYNPNTGSQISKQRILISLEAHPGVLNSSLILRGPFLASSYSLPWD